MNLETLANSLSEEVIEAQAQAGCLVNNELHSLLKEAQVVAHLAATELVEKVLAAGTALELVAILSEQMSGGDTRVSVQLRELYTAAVLADAAKRDALVLEKYLNQASVSETIVLPAEGKK